MNIKKIVETMLEIENDEDLFSLKINNIYIWKLLRIKLFLEITSKSIGYSEKFNHMKKDYKILMINFLESLTLNKKKGKDLYFISNRIQKINNEYKEIYSYNMIDKNKNNIEIVYLPLLSKKYKRKDITYSNTENIKFLYFEILGLLNIKKIYIAPEIKEKLLRVKGKLEEKLEIKELKIFDEKIIEKTIKDFNKKYFYYRKLLENKKPPKIYLVCSYGKEALIAAAKDLAIEVIEIQHGVISKYHLGYHFPAQKSIYYFPDKIYGFGEYWFKNCCVPINKKNIKIIGYSYLKNQILKYENQIKENNKQVMFISQGTIGEKIVEKAIEFAKENPLYKVIIRLHPMEFSTWKIHYKLLYDNRNMINIEISDNEQKNLYEYLYESKYIIGVYSTVIYEALYLDKKIGVLNLAGIDYVEDLIEKGAIKKIELNEKINIKNFEKLNKINKENLF